MISLLATGHNPTAILASFNSPTCCHAMFCQQVLHRSKYDVVCLQNIEVVNSKDPKILKSVPIIHEQVYFLSTVLCVVLETQGNSLQTLSKHPYQKVISYPNPAHIQHSTGCNHANNLSDHASSHAKSLSSVLNSHKDFTAKQKVCQSDSSYLNSYVSNQNIPVNLSISLNSP